ncbi:hypothetical protein F5B17DRAFT_427746 [Nemania serpens]|nr:hypothetical protein F5B17DRAFT_427746 [Nemania serpens]
MDLALPLPRTLALNAIKSAIEDIELVLNALHILPRNAHTAWRLPGAAGSEAAQARVPDEERACVARCAATVRAHLALQSTFASAQDMELSSRALTGLGFMGPLSGALSEICAALSACAGRLEANAAREAARAARGFRNRRGRLRGVRYVGVARGRKSSLRMVVGAHERERERERGVLFEILDAADTDGEETLSWDEYAASNLMDANGEGW